MNRGSGSLLIVSRNGFQSVPRGHKIEKDDQLSEGDDCHILVAYWFPRDPSLATKYDIHRESLPRQYFPRYRGGQASL
jgi:hypothetical protein